MSRVPIGLVNVHMVGAVLVVAAMTTVLLNLTIAVRTPMRTVGG